MPPRKGPYEAGGSEKAGRVMEPRNGESCGQKADGVHALEGRSPGCARASAQDNTGVCERGMSAEGERGNVGEPPVSLLPARSGGPGDHKPWRGVGASPTPRARKGDHEPWEHTRYWDASDKRSDPRRAGRQS